MDTVEHAALPLNNTMHTSVEVKSVRGLDNDTDKNSVLVRYILEQRVASMGGLLGYPKMPMDRLLL
mgnify:CR=1 FL=1